MNLTMNLLDVVGIQGNGANYDVLKEAQVDQADLIIAATSSDEINIISCLMAKKMGVGNTIARIRNPEYVKGLRMLKEDLGCEIPNNGCLKPWTQQGVLLLNTVLTVRAHQANSHRNMGWEKFTDRIIEILNEREKPIAFVLWGAPARKKKKMITNPKHFIVESAHPSPLSAFNGFFGSRPFSKVNAFLEAVGEKPINWQIPNL